MFGSVILVNGNRKW